MNLGRRLSSIKFSSKKGLDKDRAVEQRSAADGRMIAALLRGEIAQQDDPGVPWLLAPLSIILTYMGQLQFRTPLTPVLSFL